MSDFIQRRADLLLRRGNLARDSGDYVTALHEFKAAAYVARTPDALTQWGAMEHFLGDTEKAIELCREAIGLDPDCGNPYNDIGTYLVVQGRGDEAVSWFKKAIVSKRYKPRHYPHINLGKLFLARKEYEQALHHFEEALLHEPGDSEIRELVRAIRHALH
jgi:tetratricopeptide (TPR) repeat protein